MNYCNKCYNLTNEEKCPVCNNKKLSAVQDDDLCFLIERQLIWIEIIKDALDNAGIPYECTGQMGAGMAIKIGPYLESYQFKVPYKYYNQAKEITSQLFKDDFE